MKYALADKLLESGNSTTQQLFDTEVGKVVNGINGKIQTKNSSPQYTLTTSEKMYVRRIYSELNEADIPDKVELIDDEKRQDTTSPSADSEPSNNENFFTFDLCVIEQTCHTRGVQI